MKHVVRIGRLEDQDRMRRDDCLRLTPDQRVEALLRFRSQFFADDMRPLQRTARVVKREGPQHA